MIKFIIFLLTLNIACLEICTQEKKKSKASILREVSFSLDCLDSIHKADKQNTLSGKTLYHINFLSKITKIEPSSDGTYLGIFIAHGRM